MVNNMNKSLINKIQIFDGGMGSTLEELNLISPDSNELIHVEDFNITHSEIIKQIHLSYAIADYITTNTFGLNRIKYKGKYSIKEVALKAIENAKVTNKKIFFDIGPTGKLMKPIGALSFDEAYDVFKEIVLLTKDYVDGYIIETFSDLLEIKACILAVKENSDRKVYATMTFSKNHRTLTGTTPEIMVNTLEGLNVDALGVNCSLGPIELLPIVEKIMNCAHIPVIVQPNRGIPKYENGKAKYDLDAKDFESYIKKFIDLGVSIVGGCCGTTPEFINSIVKYKELDVIKKNNPYKTLVNSKEKLVDMSNIVVCGERLNPTGKKKLKEAIINENYDLIISEAINQKDSKADILDINVGIPLIDEVNVLTKVSKIVSEYVDLPLQIDSSNAKAIEEAVRRYPGIPIINSVNGDYKVMDNIFKIAGKYGAVCIGLTLDENGVPETAIERLNIVNRIISNAKLYGIDKHKIIIDTLVLSASSNQNLVAVTLDTLKEVSKLGINTTLGVSNVSFGLPNRELLNKTFLTMALNNGLKMPIVNPCDIEIMNTIKAYKVLANNDLNSENYINTFRDYKTISTNINNTINNSISNMIIKGLKPNLDNKLDKLIENELANYDNPLNFIENVLIKSLSEVGDKFEKGILYLPQLISSSESAKIFFNKVLEKIPSSLVEKGNIVIGTVKGDIHDIGKNILKVILQSYGYCVIDLGKDVPKEEFLNAYYKYKPIAFGLSALMTTTIDSMKDTINLLKEKQVNAKIFVGGAVLTLDIAQQINADYYCKNALDMINILEK